MTFSVHRSFFLLYMYGAVCGRRSVTVQSFIAALAGVDMEQHEAAIDGATVRESGYGIARDYAHGSDYADSGDRRILKLAVMRRFW